MKSIHRTMRTASVTVAAALLLAACGNGTEQSDDVATDADPSEDAADDDVPGDAMVINVGHGGAPGDVNDQAVDLFAESIAEATDGAYQIENFGASQLGDERELIEGVQLGTVDATLVTNAPLGNFVEEALFYDLPGLFNDLEHVLAVAESDIITDHLAPALEREGLIHLTTADGGFRNITNSVRPIEQLSDLEGINMRVQESPIIMATYEALPGVTPVPVPIGDLYSSLDQGVVDAQENPAILIRDFAFFEVQDYMTLTGHSYFSRHVLVNQGVWNSISEEGQAAFRDAAEELRQFKNDYYAQEDQNAIDELIEEGMEVIEADDTLRNEISEIMSEEVWPRFYEQIGGGDSAVGEGIVQQIQELDN